MRDCHEVSPIHRDSSRILRVLIALIEAIQYSEWVMIFVLLHRLMQDTFKECKIQMGSWKIDDKIRQHNVARLQSYGENFRDGAELKLNRVQDTWNDKFYSSEGVENMDMRQAVKRMKWSWNLSDERYSIESREFS